MEGTGVFQSLLMERDQVLCMDPTSKESMQQCGIENSTDSCKATDERLPGITGPSTPPPPSNPTECLSI